MLRKGNSKRKAVHASEENKAVNSVHHAMFMKIQ